ncbi:hypothetical protein AAC387_Pa12g0521 [Persea americana]
MHNNWPLLCAAHEQAAVVGHCGPAFGRQQLQVCMGIPPMGITEFWQKGGLGQLLPLGCWASGCWKGLLGHWEGWGSWQLEGKNPDR